MPPVLDITQKAIPENPLDKEKKSEESVISIYSDKDRAYLSFLQARLERIYQLNNQSFPELNNITRYKYYEDNEKIANTHHLDPKKNPDDVVVSAGTVEQKLDSLLSHINNLNLSPEVFAFDKNNDKVTALGQALEDIIYDTEIRDGADGGGDEEKKLSRQRELLKQGTVFVQEEWVKKFETKKILKQKYKGEFKDFAGYTDALELVFEGPSRTILYTPNVFLGDLTKFHMENQPDVFVLIQTNYDDAKARYGKFENWKFVHKGRVPLINASDPKTIFDNKWRLTDLKDDQVEIILYQAKPSDEFQIVINGVLMLPVGFPLSAVSPRGEYNIAKQVFRIINDKFAFGASFVSSGSVKEISAILDEMLKLFVLKTRKSFTPAYVNTSGRVIDRKVLSPGRISMGIDPGSLTPIAGNEVQGITAGETAFFDKMNQLIDKSTVSEQFTGQKSGAQQTATEVLELQRQARLTLGLTVAACMLLEKKLALLRLYNILDNWFEPVDTKVMGVEEARKLVNSYRKVTRETAIPGEGPGERQVILQDDKLPDAQSIRDLELVTEKARGTPVRQIYINPTELRKAGILWYVVINSKERESSPFFKTMFKEMLADMLSLMQLGSVPNKEGLEEEFARIWGKPRNKLFASTQMSPDMAGISAAGGSARAPGRGNTAGVPMTPGALAGAM